MNEKRHTEIVAHIMDMVQAPPETIEVFQAACMHGSWINEHPQADGAKYFESNERLEFLGDSVLGLVVADALYQGMPKSDEGLLSKAKARLVSTKTLIRYAEQLALGEALLLGKGEETSGGRKRISVVADTLEAFIGAVFLTRGFETAKTFVLSIWGQAITEEIDGFHQDDFKSALQEFSQNRTNELPVYKILKIIGPDHNRSYEMAVFIQGHEMGRGDRQQQKRSGADCGSRGISEIKKRNT